MKPLSLFLLFARAFDFLRGIYNLRAKFSSQSHRPGVERKKKNPSSRIGPSVLVASLDAWGWKSTGRGEKWSQAQTSRAECKYHFPFASIERLQAKKTTALNVCFPGKKRSYFVFKLLRFLRWKVFWSYFIIGTWCGVPPSWWPHFSSLCTCFLRPCCPPLPLICDSMCWFLDEIATFIHELVHNVPCFQKNKLGQREGLAQSHLLPQRLRLDWIWISLIPIQHCKVAWWLRG